MNELFEEQRGHLTDYALGALASEDLDELARLEIAEHLAFCDHCLERYTRILDREPLLETPDLFVPSVRRAFRRKMARLTASRYFTVSVSACIALVLWVTGVFSLPAARRQEEKARPDAGLEGRLPELAQKTVAEAGLPAGPPFSITQAAEATFNNWAGGLSDFFGSIDLRGVFSDEKK